MEPSCRYLVCSVDSKGPGSSTKFRVLFLAFSSALQSRRRPESCLFANSSHFSHPAGKIGPVLSSVATYCVVLYPFPVGVEDSKPTRQHLRRIQTFRHCRVQREVGTFLPKIVYRRLTRPCTCSALVQGSFLIGGGGWGFLFPCHRFVLSLTFSSPDSEMHSPFLYALGSSSSFFPS